MKPRKEYLDMATEQKGFLHCGECKEQLTGRTDVDSHGLMPQFVIVRTETFCTKCAEKRGTAMAEMLVRKERWDAKERKVSRV